MSIDPAHYPNLRFTGPISAKVVKPDDIGSVSPVLLVGPTGAGKSTFVEALAHDASLHISSNQLEGFTQTINTYFFESITWSRLGLDEGAHLVDVPGFADTKISTTNIVCMLKRWIRASGASNFGRILYFTPIHSVRLPGSHREMLRTFQALTGAKSGGNITIVTTMWDNLWGDGASKRAERNFSQLRDNVWKEFIDEGSQIVQFHNTQESALSILNTAFRRLVGVEFGLEIQFQGDKQLKSAPFANHLMDDLQTRIQNLELEMTHTTMDLRGASERGDDLLISTLIPQLKEKEMLLAQFKAELYDNFGIVQTAFPSLPSTTDGPSNIGTPVVTSQPIEPSIPHASPSLSTGSAAAELETTLRPPLPFSSPFNQPDSRVSPNTNPIPLKQTFITRVISSVKCWGDTVADRHDA